MMSHDEIRVYNQCAACRARNLDGRRLCSPTTWKTCIAASAR